MILRTLLLIFGCFLPTWSRLPEELREVRENDSKCYQQCFHQPAESCPDRNDPCRCHQLTTCKKAVVCCDVNDHILKEQLRCGNLIQNEIEALHIRNATLEVLNLNLPEWKNLRSMTITDGHIRNVSEAFPKMTMVSCLNLSSNGIKEFQKRSLFNLFSLSFLDLSHNNLTEVPSFKIDGAITLDILGNPSILCSSVKETLNRTKLTYNNENSTICSLVSKNFQWFGSKDQIAMSELRRVHELENNCIKNCTCFPHNLVLGVGQPRVITVGVNCSKSNLLTLPKPLPPYTVTLDVSNNNITSLKELSDPSYQRLIDLKADNNQITSIASLEGTPFKSIFQQLSLRNNKIKNIDPYLLEFYRSSVSTRVVYLGLNELTCDCTTITDFKVWLQTKSDFIKDYKEITCEDTHMRVIDLDLSKYCRSHEDWTDYIYWIIGAEVFLLISLIAKVSYDYWVFKTAGYLPWPASKMPRLPCDWLCE